MSDENQPAWSDEADAVFVSTLASIEGLSTYGERMNCILNLVRHMTMTEVAEGIMRATNNHPTTIFVEMRLMTGGMQSLIDDFADELKKMPKRIEAIMHAEHGCGGCSACKAHIREAYADGKVVARPSAASKAAIESLIETMTGKK